MAYTASKAAINNLTLSTARALAPEVRVNALCPGGMLGAWTRKILTQEQYDDGSSNSYTYDGRGNLTSATDAGGHVTTFLYDHSKAAPTAIDHREHAVTFEVLDATRHQHGMLFLPSRWTVTRSRGGRNDVLESES